ncbi:hypothetical protein VNO78_25522 [Psophocarpus tetragonolobus]|uniref:Non-specific lipid-transfer protein n=1 Tax=Psophocarpus tetragonolobus TaxID=3891 RepID=A0AAN9XF36_PSOTE
MASLKLACMVAVVCMIVVCAPMAHAAITCGQVVNLLRPCINYIKSGGPVPGPCCNGVRTLKSASKTTSDRQAACNCLKAAASTISGYNNGYAASLPTKCGVNIPYTISPNTNCANIKV